jgi:hypothetical protein
MEPHGWEVTVETMKGYLEMAELALGADGRWELGRCAGWCVTRSRCMGCTVDN